MPYSPDKPPVDKINGLSKLSDKKQRQWVRVFNSSKGDGDSEETAIKKAWGVVKKNKGEKMKTAEKLTEGFSKVARETVYDSTVGLNPQELRQQLVNLRKNREEDSLTSYVKGLFGGDPVIPTTVNNNPNSRRAVKGVKPNITIGTGGSKGSVDPVAVPEGYFENIIRNNFVVPAQQGNARSKFGLGWF